MKKLITLILICSSIVPSLAQKNVLKINILSLALGNISMQEEYSINGHSSVALGASYLPSRGLPGFAVSNDPSNNAKDLSFSGFSITPEYRYYLKGNGPKGLYFAGYIRYSKYSADKFNISYDRTSGGINNLLLTGDFTTTVGGIMLGSQWLLGDKWTLDWWILGAGFGSLKGEFESTGDFTSEDQTDIKNEVASIDVPSVDINVTTSSTSTKLTIESKVPAFRGFGLCLGYRF